jgi:hypothetical protein
MPNLYISDNTIYVLNVAYSLGFRLSECDPFPCREPCSSPCASKEAVAVSLPVDPAVGALETSRMNYQTHSLSKHAWETKSATALEKQQHKTAIEQWNMISGTSVRDSHNPRNTKHK